MYDLLLKDGDVIDPAQGIHGKMDVAVTRGKVAALAGSIAPTEAKKVISVEGKIVSPGLIDLHTHIADGIIALGATPDEVGILSGVTALCDAGSTGWANFNGFKRYVVAPARTDVFCFLFVYATGQAVENAPWEWHDVNAEAMLKTIEANRDIIKGVKLRATASMMENGGLEGVRAAKKVAAQAGLPLMVHIGRDDTEKISHEALQPLTRGLLPILDDGDIITHCFTGKPGNILQADGKIMPEVWEAIQRGVVMDVATARTNFSFAVARQAIAQGMLPDTISTDITGPNHNTRVVSSLVVTMSKFLTLGLSLEQVIAMTTINAARALGEDSRRGSIKVGMPADITVLELVEGDFRFYDNIEETNPVAGKQLLIPKLVLKNGIVNEAQSRYH
jgi:dihydroorotase